MFSISTDYQDFSYDCFLIEILLRSYFLVSISIVLEGKNKNVVMKEESPVS